MFVFLLGPVITKIFFNCVPKGLFVGFGFVSNSLFWSAFAHQRNGYLGTFGQPRSQGSLLPALRSRRAGRREPWERG